MKNKKILTVISLNLLLLITMGVTYAYFSASLRSENGSRQIVTETGNLELNYIDGDYIVAENVVPGWSANKTLVVTNVGSLDAYYKIFWRELTNTIVEDELVLQAVCTSYENYNTEQQTISGYCDDITETPVAKIAGSVKDSIGIESGYTHVYSFTFTFKEMSSLQNYNQGKLFSGQLNIDDSVGIYTMNGTLIGKGGNPLSNTLITLSSGQSTTTNEQGKFTLENVSEGNYTIRVGGIIHQLIVGTGKELKTYGQTIVSNIENREINITVLVGDNDLTYDVISTNEYDINVIALYVDGIKVSNLSNEKHYDLISSSCTNGESVLWDNLEKAITIKPMTSTTKCTVNFNERPYLTLTEQILQNNTANSDSSIDFASVSSTTNGQGLYFTSNLSKTEGGKRVYYYRGNVNNNYVQFAGFCWKLVRTNEDGSVKLIYWGPQNGTSCSTTSVMSDTLTSKSFNSVSNDNRYVGYMYGASCTNYSTCHTNTTSSPIKNLLDTWYDDNINTKGLEITSKIANTIYCNDRTIGAAGAWNNNTYGSLGYGANATLYGAARRLGTGGVSGTTWSSENAKPQYDCPNNERDAFTLKVSKGGTSGFGNNALDYPVGLLTADEISYAGGAATLDNSSYFLYTGNSYWTMSPFYYDGTSARAWNMYSSGYLNFNSMHYTVPNVLPVISLKSTALVSEGDGHPSTPYVID